MGCGRSKGHYSDCCGGDEGCREELENLKKGPLFRFTILRPACPECGCRGLVNLHLSHWVREVGTGSTTEFEISEVLLVCSSGNGHAWSSGLSLVHG